METLNTLAEKKYIIECGRAYEESYPVLVVDTKEQAEQKVREFEESVPEYCEEYADELNEAELIASAKAAEKWPEDSEEYWQEYERVFALLEDKLEEKYPSKTPFMYETEVFYFYTECPYEGEDNE